MGRTLADAINESPYTQAKLAGFLDVSRSVVARWAVGAEPVPRRRVPQLQSWVGDWDLEETPASTGYFPLPDEDTTLFGWMLRYMGGHLGDTWSQRIQTLAERSGSDPSDIQAWAEGLRRIPVGEAKDVLTAAWPGMNLVPFRFEVGAPITEDLAVSLHLRLISNMGGLTFQQAKAELERREIRFRADPTIDNPKEVANKLREWGKQAQPVNEKLEEMAKKFSEERDRNSK